MRVITERLEDGSCNPEFFALRRRLEPLNIPSRQLNATKSMVGVRVHPAGEMQLCILKHEDVAEFLSDRSWSVWGIFVTPTVFLP